MAASFAVLAAVISGITAGPAIAQAVKYALIQNRDEPARQPFLIVGLSGSVPTGKRYVIEHFFMRCDVSLPGAMTGLTLFTEQPTNEAYAVAHRWGPNGNGFDQYTADATTRLYMDAGHSWGLEGETSSGNLSSCHSGTSGYSIDVP